MALGNVPLPAFLQSRSLGHCPRRTAIFFRPSDPYARDRKLRNQGTSKPSCETSGSRDGYSSTSSCQMWKPRIYCSISSIQVNTEIPFEYITWDEFVVWLMSLGQDEATVLETGSDLLSISDTSTPLKGALIYPPVSRFTKLNPSRRILAIEGNYHSITVTPAGFTKSCILSS